MFQSHRHEPPPNKVCLHVRRKKQLISQKGSPERAKLHLKQCRTTACPISPTLQSYIVICYLRTLNKSAVIQF